MKKLILLLIAAILSSYAMNAQKEVDNFDIQVDGLGCPFCAYGLEKKFKEFKGIKNISIQIETGDFSFNYPSAKALSIDDVVQQVKKAGYTPITAKITRANGKVEKMNTTKISNENSGNLTSTSFKVEGNCDMCKARIEAASLTIDGVQNAVWNKESKEILISFNTEKTSAENIGKKIAKEGHDNIYQKSSIEIYESLPMCCTYRNLNSKTH